MMQKFKVQSPIGSGVKFKKMSKIQNPKSVFRFLRRELKFDLSFGFGHLGFQRQGITLLLIIILLSAIMSVSLGIFNIVMGELRISGEISDSFIAFYAADQGIEKILYFDRVARTICGTPGLNCFMETTEVESGACYAARASKIGSTTDMVVAGQYRCGVNPSRVVKRGFELTY